MPYTYHVQVEATTMRQVEIESNEPLSEADINVQGVDAFKKQYGSDFEDITVFDYSQIP